MDEKIKEIIEQLQDEIVFEHEFLGEVVDKNCYGAGNSVGCIEAYTRAIEIIKELMDERVD